MRIPDPLCLNSEDRRDVMVNPLTFALLSANLDAFRLMHRHLGFVLLKMLKYAALASLFGVAAAFAPSQSGKSTMCPVEASFPVDQNSSNSFCSIQGYFLER